MTPYPGVLERDLILPVPKDSADRTAWLESRRKHVTGTDLSAIVGESPFASAFEVYLEKLGLLPEKPETESMEMGNALESAVAQVYANRTGHSLQKIRSVIEDPLEPIFGGTPDFLCLDDEDLGLEVKTTGEIMRHKVWGESGTDAIPDYYKIQSQWYMMLTGRRRWDVALLVAGQRVEIFHLIYDEPLVQLLRNAAIQFWNEHVAPQIEPEDRTRKDLGAYKAYILARHPKDDGSEIEADMEFAQLADELAACGAACDAADQDYDAVALKCQERMGDAKKVKGDGWSFSFTAPKPKDDVDYPQVCSIFRHKLIAAGVPEAELDQIMSNNTTTKQGKRTFRPSLPKE